MDRGLGREAYDVAARLRVAVVVYDASRARWLLLGLNRREGAHGRLNGGNQ